MFAFVVAGVTTLAGCAGAGTSDEKSGSDAGGSATLEFWTINLKEGYTPYITSNIKKFETEHPGVKVNWLDIPDYEQTQTKLLTAISGGTAPDVVNVTPFILPKFAATGALNDISTLKGGTALASKYTESYWDAGVIDGKSYAIPYYGSSPALLYNKKLFADAGLDPNNPPGTWQEVFAAARQIKDKTGVAGMAQTLDDFNDAGNPIDIVASQAGAPLLNSGGDKAAFVTPEAVGYLGTWAEGIRDGWMSKTSVNGTSLDAAKELAQGKVAMTFNGPWLKRWLKDNSSATVYNSIAVAAHPESPTGQINSFLQQFVIPKGSKHPDQALELATFFSGSVVELAKLAPVVPILKTSLNDPEFTSLPDAKVLTSQPSTFFWPLVPEVSELLESLRQEMQAILLGRTPAQAGLQDAAAKWDKILAK